MNEIQGRGGLNLMSYFTRVILFTFYLATIISLFLDPWNVYVDFRQSYLIIGNTLIILGIVIFLLSFIRDIIRYINEKKR